MWTQTHKQNEEQFSGCKNTHTIIPPQNPQLGAWARFDSTQVLVCSEFSLHIYVLSPGKGSGDQNNAALYQPNLATSWSRYVCLLCLGAHPSEDFFSEERKCSSWLLLVTGRHSGHSVLTKEEKEDYSVARTTQFRQLATPFHLFTAHIKGERLLFLSRNAERGERAKLGVIRLATRGFPPPPSIWMIELCILCI